MPWGTKGHHSHNTSHLPHGHAVTRVRGHRDLHTLQQPFQLVAHVPRPLHRPVLDEVLVAPLAGKIGVRPLVEDIEQCQVVSPLGEEVLAGGVGMHDLVFGAVEDGIVDGEHGSDGDDFFGALVPDGVSENINSSIAEKLSKS